MDEDTVAFRDLPVYEAAAGALADTDLLHAAVEELRQRLTSGVLDFEARHDIACDLLEVTDRLHAFALRVMA